MKTLYLLLYRYRLNHCEPYERKKWLGKIGDLKKEMDTKSFEYKFKVFKLTRIWPLSGN